MAYTICTIKNVWEKHWIHLQATDSKYSDERLFLPRRQAELPNYGHREHNDCEVGHNVHAAVDEPDRILIETFERVLQRPESLNWLASEYAAEYGPERVHYDDGHDRPASDLELLGGEYALILQKD